MAMTPYTGDPLVISKLGTTPQERGLNTEQFKAKFDEGLKEFVTWFNSTHKTEFDAHLADNVTDSDGAHGLKIETGTFTPYIYGTTTAGENTYSQQRGYYTRIGDRVFIDIYVYIDTKDEAMAGNLAVGGLPFTSKLAAYGYKGGTLSIIDNVNFADSWKQVVARMTDNSTAISLYKILSNAISGAIQASEVGRLRVGISINYDISL
jgi:hypothetical protein